MLKRIFTVITILVCGSAVMIIEIIGTKILSPFFGVNLYVWSAQITVTLVSLAAGYWTGGLLADKKPSAAALYGIILAAGVLTAFLPFEAAWVIERVEPLGLKFGSLAASFILFAVPLLLLGMVTPYIVKLCVGGLDRVGGTTGRLYAVSTAGSLAGTLAASFLLIPNISIRMNVFFLAGSLAGLGLAGILIYGARKELIARAALVAILAALAVFFLKEHFGNAAPAGILYTSQGFYGQIKVVDHNGVRSLLVDGSTQNMVVKDPPTDSLFEKTTYTVYLAGVLAMRPETKKVLMIGLGGGVIAKIFSGYGAVVDVIEIDPRMEGVAARFFGYSREGGEVILGDGRYVIQRLAKEGRQYDAVILDAFASYDQPSHLFTREMFAEIRKVLAKGGILGINSTGFAKGKASRVTRSIYRTLKEVFGNVSAFRISAVNKMGNFVFFASDGALEFLKSPCRLACSDQEKLIQILEAHPVGDRLNGGIVLTDNYNPIAYWGIPVYREWHEIILKFFGRKILEAV